jgi:hypothetical protein
MQKTEFLPRTAFGVVLYIHIDFLYRLTLHCKCSAKTSEIILKIIILYSLCTFVRSFVCLFVGLTLYPLCTQCAGSVYFEMRCDGVRQASSTHFDFDLI